MKKENGFEEIVAIQLGIHFWPGQIQLKPEDIGKKPEDIPEIFFLGNKKLYPEEWRKMFRHIGGKARAYLNDHSFPFVLDYVRAIPKRNLAKMVERLQELKAEYMEKVEEFLANYEEIREEWREQYADFWPRLAPHYPAKEMLRWRFDINWNVFELRGAEPPKAGSAPEIIEAYQQAREKLQYRYEQMVDEAAIYLRKKVLDTVQNLSSRLKDGRIIRNETLEGVRRVEGWFKDLNIFGDMEVEEALTQLRTALNGTDLEGLKDNSVLKQHLMKLADQVAAVAGKLDDVSVLSGNYKRMIDLS